MAQIKIGAAVGLNVGAPIPSKINKGAKGQLGINPRVGIWLSKENNSKFYYSASIFFEQKSARYSSPVNYDYIVIKGDSIDGFSGLAQGRIKNYYLNIPVELFYKLNKRFAVGGGFYAAYLLKGNHTGVVKNGKAGFGGSFPIDDQLFDEHKNIHRIDFGVQTGMRFQLMKQLALQWQLSYGITSVTKPSDNFQNKLHNVYTSVNLSYQFF